MTEMSETVAMLPGSLNISYKYQYLAIFEEEFHIKFKYL